MPLVNWLLRLLGVEEDQPFRSKWEDGTPRPKVWLPPTTTLAEDIKRLKS